MANTMFTKAEIRKMVEGFVGNIEVSPCQNGVMATEPFALVCRAIVITSAIRQRLRDEGPVSFTRVLGIIIKLSNILFIYVSLE
jgi:hypothetical protein